MTAETFADAVLAEVARVRDLHEKRGGGQQLISCTALERLAEQHLGRRRAGSIDFTEQGRRLASRREDLIAQGANPAALDIPLHLARQGGSE